MAKRTIEELYALIYPNEHKVVVPAEKPKVAPKVPNGPKRITATKDAPMYDHDHLLTVMPSWMKS